MIDNWFFELPKHWGIEKIKYIALYSPHSISTEQLQNKNFYYYDIPTVQVTGAGREEEGNNIDSNKFLLSGGELLISKLNPRKGTVVLTEGNNLDVICSTEFVPLKVTKNVLDKFLYYVLITDRVADYLNKYVKSATRSHQRVNPQDILNMRVPVPEKNIQHKIVSYLDSKLIILQKVISSKKKLIELLEQQRQSIITEAVTKGLNPNVKMKDSGVEWIGEIPEHWNISKVKYTSYLLNGDRGENYPSGNDFLDDGIPFITSHNLNKRYIDYTNCKYISDERYNLLRGIKIENRDIIYCLRGSVGKNAMATHSEGTIASSLMGIRAKNNINPEFLLYVLNSKVEVWNRSLLTTGSVSDNLSAENVGSYIIPYPDLEEQERIVSYLIKKLNELDKLSDIVEIQIEELKEYRQSLIYEAVTGKINISDMELV